MAEVSSVSVRLSGTELPGRTFRGADGGVIERCNVHLGVQCARDIIDLVPGDAQRASFAFDVTVKAGRFSGPFVHGRGADRFLYLSWGDLSDDGVFTMFRRAKLRLEALDANALVGAVLEGRLTLGGVNGPLCGSVRPPAITWAVAR